MHPSIEKLLKVQGVDRQIRFLQDAIEARPRELDADRRKVAAAQARVDEVGESIQRGRVEIDQGEMEIRTADEQIQKSRVALNQAKSNEEYGVLKSQMERAAEERGALEERILERISEMEQLEEEEKRLAAERDEQKARLQKKESEVEELVRGLREKLETARTERAGLTEDVDPEHLSLYERLLERHGPTAVCAVRDGVCQGCYMSLTQQDINVLLAGREIVRCRSCSRLLYLE